MALEKGREVHKLEREYGQFLRRFALPNEVPSRGPFASARALSVAASGVVPLSEVRALLRTAPANLLLVGAEAAVVDLLDGLRPNCRQPVETCQAGSFLALSPPSRPGTLILRDVGTLSQEGQRRLMDWLDDNDRNRIQVITTNAVALWPQVRDGAFTEALYYRLNVLYIDLTDGAAFSTET